MQAPGGWEHLPHELVVSIFKYLQASDRVRASTVCSQWFRVFHDPVLWRSWEVCLTDDEEQLLESIESLRHVIHFLGMFARRLVILCPGRQREVETEPLLWGYLTCLLQGLRLRGTPKMAYFKLRCCLDDYFLNRGSETYQKLIVCEIANFLKSQACLNFVDLQDSRLSTKYAETILDSIVRSRASTTIDTIDLINFYDLFPSHHTISGQLRNVFASCQNLKQINLNYRYLVSVGVETVCQMLCKTLQLLVIESGAFSSLLLLNDSGIISSESWRQACENCPGLKVELLLPPYRSHLRLYLVEAMPLTEVRVMFKYPPAYEGELGDTVSMLFYHLGHHFCGTLEVVHMSTSAFVNVVSTPTKESLVFFLQKCLKIKQLTVTPQIMTPALIQSVMTVVREGNNFYPDVIYFQ